MVPQVLDAMRPHAGGVYCDGTAGRGGHAQAILEASEPDGRLIAIDRDPSAVESVRRRLEPFGARATVVHARYSAIRGVLEDEGFGLLDGLLVDLGVSLPQLQEPSRGMSFQLDGPIDMRMDPSRGETARDVIEGLSEEELADAIREYGEERRARAVAKALKAALRRGELQSTLDLAQVVRRAVGRPRAGKVDSATRTFQALRILVNDELGELESLLDELPEILAEGGRAAFLSFHSLEDRAVKHGLRRWSQCRCAPRSLRCECGGAQVRVLTRKPITPEADELSSNPRARSAKLRAAERIAPSHREVPCA
jgi:16S rRNA (cytosine1402-N4)-methyltransferase